MSSRLVLTKQLAIQLAKHAYAQQRRDIDAVLEVGDVTSLLQAVDHDPHRESVACAVLESPAQRFAYGQTRLGELATAMLPIARVSRRP